MIGISGISEALRYFKPSTTITIFCVFSVIASVSLILQIRVDVEKQSLCNPYPRGAMVISKLEPRQKAFVVACYSDLAVVQNSYGEAESWILGSFDKVAEQKEREAE